MVLPSRIILGGVVIAGAVYVFNMVDAIINNFNTDLFRSKSASVKPGEILTENKN